MRTRLASAVLLALLTATVATGAALAQWPTTCVELNDIAEAHLGNTENVGIYQRVFGLGAEEACQRDHGDDVRSVFAWAALVVTTAPVSDISRETNWVYGAKYDPITSHYFTTASVETEGGSKIQAQCNVTTSNPGLLVKFGGFTYFSTGYSSNEIDVIWRIDNGAPVSNEWSVTDSDIVWIPQSQMDEMARQLVHASRFVLRVQESTVEFSFSGAGSPNHPVAYVLRACGRNV